MFFKYLRSELLKRSKQTILISSGMAVAIALVLLVSGLATGIKSAQTEALSGLYGVGTDISVSKTETPEDGGQGMRPNFQIGAEDGSTSGETRTFSRSRLTTQIGTGVLTADEVSAVSNESLAKTVVATLKLNSTTFNGELPTFSQNSNGSDGQGMPAPGDETSGSTDGGGSTDSNTAPRGGFDGQGGAQFDIDQFSVEGVPTDDLTAGPLAATEITDGRNFSADDADSYVAVVDSTYAAGNEISVGDELTVGGEEFEVIGIIKSATASSTSSNVYIPIALAQTLSDNEDSYTNMYVVATDSTQIAALKTAIESDVEEATVSSQDDLAKNVSGSLGTASSLTSDMGGWLSAVVLLAAFATAILFTTSGVNRRIREFGTLKAIGWRSSRIVRQVAGESIFNGLLGGIIGVALGTIGVFVINAFGPSLSAGVASATSGFGPGGMGGFGGGRPGLEEAASATETTIQLTASIEPYMYALAIGFALIGGLLAGAFGGLRAAKLSPAVALRSVA